MKGVLIPLAFIAGNVLACPADGTKDAAAAPDNSKPVIAAKAKATTTTAATKSVTKVAAKSATAPRKTTAL